MTSVPKVSVVIATRNRRALVEEAVTSVTQQQGVSWELIVVDDASTDETWSYLSTLTKARTFRQEVQSERSHARNRGLQEARGNYVMFLDDDDYLHVGALCALSVVLEQHPEAVAAVGAREDWFVAENYRRRDIHPLRTRARPLFDEFLFGWSAVSGQNLFRAETLRRAGGYEASVVPCEDRELWLRVSRLGPIVLCPQTVMTYRIGPKHALPSSIRPLRERVARRAIRALPRQEWRAALTLRRCTELVDSAEDDMHLGRPWEALPKLGRAVWLAPQLILSPLIGTWIARRLLGRAYHRYVRR